MRYEITCPQCFKIRLVKAKPTTSDIKICRSCAYINYHRKQKLIAAIDIYQELLSVVEVFENLINHNASISEFRERVTNLRNRLAMMTDDYQADLLK